MKNLQIPTAIQGLLDSINSTKLDLGEIKIDKHPLLSQDLDRYIQINKISIDLNLPRTYIWYSQILKDSEGNIIPSNLPTPEWMISEIETSSLRDENFQRIEVPVADSETEEPLLNEDGTPKMSPLFVNSHKYLLWLLKNNKVGFLQLLSAYLNELLQDIDFKSSLNQLS
ncbi:hypothetical protein GCM10010992_15250 [Cloacibacterium rupense]|uniref:Uncharacterized protein n=1 Tax=Cloacibacterium rupense TaxID=517423 RepID=A0ABQ2NLC7_9FLAO|nr:hypothetical protein [Cloacibacterium rupense]GGP04203.1 hypothetical protein GCM10010992_15250 [Cloacibacterium rupense]